MNIAEMKEIVDSMYSDFDWYSGKFSKNDKALFLDLLGELYEAVRK